MDIFLQPHRDDVCFSLSGSFRGHLPGTLITVFTQSLYAPGFPELSSSFRPRVAAVTSLRESEDAEFARQVSLTRLDLGFPEPRLRGRLSFGDLLQDDEPEIKAAIFDTIESIRKRQLVPGKRRLFVPLGVGGHIDHLLVSSCIFHHFEQLSANFSIFFYEELPYASQEGVLLPAVARASERLKGVKLRRSRIYLFPEDRRRKLELIQVYRSQFERPPNDLKSFAVFDSLEEQPAEALWAADGLEYGQQDISHQESDEARQRHWPPAWGPRPPASGNFLVPLTASPLEAKNWAVAGTRAAKKDISCVLTLHAEGLIAHKTIRSINRAMKYAEQRGLGTELLIVLDRETDETRRYVETSSIIDPATCIISTDLGDPGLARNAAIERACGEYVAIIDGDDLISENWLVRAREVNRLSHCYVIHPEVSVYFDQKTLRFYSPDQQQEDFNETNLIVQNYWTALSFSRRETFLLIPYDTSPLLLGFGFSDWQWNCEVLARGFVHKVAPGTAHFIRVKEKGSRNAEAASRNVLMRHSALFDNFRSRSVRENGVSAQSPALSDTTETLNQGRGDPVHCFTAMLDKMVGSLISRLPMRIRRAIFSAKMPPDWDEERYLACHPDVKLAVESSIMSSGFEHWVRHGRLEGRRLAGAKGPKWLSNEMLALSDIEPKLFPSRTFFDTATEYRPMMTNEAGPLYMQLLEEIGDQSLTHVFLLPWLKAGGADLVALHHIRTLSSEFGAQILVVLTEDTDSPWLQRLPESVTTLHFGRAASRIDPSEAQVVLARLLLKVHPAVIHNINSPIGWQIFGRYGAALSCESKLYVSLFCFDYTAEQEPTGFARELEKAHTYLHGVLTDNQKFADKLMELHGLRDSLFSVLRYPVRVVPRFAYIEDDRQPKILWASRLDREKRPDILQKIAESLPDCIFHVYGDSLLERSSETAQTYEVLRKMKNVTMFGSFSGFDAIPTDNYALFLYTSQWDGMPNIVLEALAAGLAVLAPDVGGIGEVIPSDSGFLIGQFDDVQTYVEAIRRVTANPQMIFAERDKRLKLLREQYSPEAFIASLAGMPLYTLTEACSRT
jgi:glycosyltransferase involved in cell wall biosynthesis